MVKFILTMVIKMFMSFVGMTLVEDTEVYNVDDAYVTKYEEMDYTEILNYEMYLDKEEEQNIDFIGVEYEDGTEMYGLVYDCNEFEFQIVTNNTGDILAYNILYYKD